MLLKGSLVVLYFFLKAISNNPSMTMSANSDKQKNEFLEKLDKISIEELVNQYIK